MAHCRGTQGIQGTAFPLRLWLGRRCFFWRISGFDNTLGMQKWRNRIVISPKCWRLLPFREAILDLGCQRLQPFPLPRNLHNALKELGLEGDGKAHQPACLITNITVFTILPNTSIISTPTRPIFFFDLQPTLSSFWGISESAVFFILKSVWYFFEIPVKVTCFLRAGEHVRALFLRGCHAGFSWTGGY